MPTIRITNAVSEDDLPDDWITSKGDAVKKVLTELTAVYNLEGNTIPVKYAKQSHADKDGEYIGIDPLFWKKVDPKVEGPNILRVLDDILAHEVGHFNWSDLESKEAFTECYPGWGQVPGAIANILEDEYDDAKRMRKYYGMRHKRAYRVMLQAKTDWMTPDLSDVEEQVNDGYMPEANLYMNALHQTALFGAVKGLEEMEDSDDIAEFCGYAKLIINRVRNQDDPDERFKLFHVMMQLFSRYVDKPEDFDGEGWGDGAGKTTSGEADEAPATMDGEPGIDMPEGMKEMLEEMLKEMIEEGEFVPESGDPGSGTVIEIDLSDVEMPEGAEEKGGESVGSISPDTSGEGDPEPESAADPYDDLDAGDEEGSEDGSEDGPGDDSGSDGDEGESGGDMDRGSDSPDTDTSSDELGKDDRNDIDGGKATHHVHPDIDDDLEGGIEERYDVNLDEVDKIDDRDRDRWARLLKTVHDYDLDIEKRKRERDERITNNRERWSGSKRRRSEGLKQRAERNGVISELEEGFRELVSREVPQPDTRGARIDPINIARRASGDVTVTELFEEEQIIETGDRCVGFCTDISGSMSGDIDELKIAGGVTATATELIGDEFVWEAFTDRHPSDHEPVEERLDLRVVTGPNEEFRWKHVDSFMSCANEPTAAGVRDCFNLMQQTDANEYMMIVVTDGMALVEEDGTLNRGGNAPVEHARQAVNEVRRRGVDVIGLGIGSMSEKKMEETFGGGNYRLTNIDRLANDILELYRGQLDSVRLGGR